MLYCLFEADILKSELHLASFVMIEGNCGVHTKVQPYLPSLPGLTTVQFDGLKQTQPDYVIIKVRRFSITINKLHY